MTSLRMIKIKFFKNISKKWRHGGRYVNMSNMLKYAFLLALGLQGGPPGYTLIGPYSPLSYGSSPTDPLHLTQYSQVFGETAYVEDKDTWWNNANHAETILVPNPDTTIEFTCRSGTQQLNPNESYNADTGRRTITWTVIGWTHPEIDALGKTLFVDDFEMNDAGGAGDDVSPQVSHNTIVYPNVGGGGGGGR